jgi:hypothetical protein
MAFWWTVETVAGIVPWLKKAIAHFYPNSFYAAYLSPEVRERAAKRLLQRPKTGFSVIRPQFRRTLPLRCGSLVGRDYFEIAYYLRPEPAGEDGITSDFNG